MEPPDLQDLCFILVSYPTLLTLVILGILLLLILSALVSGSEIAYFSLDPNDIEALKSDASPVTKSILSLKDKPRTLLATILIANNFINISIVLLSNYLTGKIFPSTFFNSIAYEIINIWPSWAGEIQLDRTSQVIQFLITVIGVTFFLVMFGEILPKIYANVNNIKLAKLMARPLSFLNYIFSPFSSMLVNWSVRMEKKLIRDRSLSIKEDIDHAIELTVRNEKSHDEEVDILKSIVKFSDVPVKQVMCSRVDVIAVDISTNYVDLMKIVKESGFSRIPVYEEDFDNVVGILYIKDLLNHLNEPEDFKWQNLIHNEVLYAPESKRLNELLKEIQRKKTHMVIIVDEYGGSSGIVTLEDIMEEVIGEIKDEFDDEEIDYLQIDDKNFIFDGKSLINDVARIVGIEIEYLDKVRGDADSIAGLVLENTGLLPKENRVIRFPMFTLKIISVNERRIEKIQFTNLE